MVVPRLAAGNRFGAYEIVSTLGEGGMGEVYLAQDTRLPRRVALKMLLPESIQSPENLRRFEQEARSASSLNHPNILTVYEFGQHQGKPFIASEYVDGLTLRQMLSRPLDTATVVDLAIQAARGLNAAHEAGIVHRDIKPENLMVRGDGLLKILDFGLARVFEHAAAARNASDSGRILGTTRYMSPEQARALAVDGRTDIFSLGAVMYEMIAGEAPFQGDTDSDRIAAILLRNPPPLQKVARTAPAELVRIVERAMSKDPRGRYQSVRELLAALQTLKVDSQPVGHLPRISRRTIAIALTTSAALAGTYFYVRSRPPALPAPGHPTSLAILPFRNLRQDPDSDFLGLSLADAVITKFGYIKAIAIRPSSAVEKYRNRIVDPRQAGAELKADVLLAGSYLRDGNRLRINLQLIDARQNRVLSRDTIDARYDDLFGLQDRLAQQIIEHLELNLSPGEVLNVKSDNPIAREAYENYLRGVDLYAMNDFPGAIRYLERSASMEPGYAFTWAHLGQAYTTNASLGFGGRDQYRRAQDAYTKALALNPALIEARVFMANLFTDTGQVEESVPVLRAALERNPNSADAHWELGYAFRFAGLLPESVRECERARQIDPQVKLYSSALNAYLYLGQYGRFLDSLPQSDSAYILFYRGFAEYYLRDYQAALSHFDRAAVLDASQFQAVLGRALGAAIRRDYPAGLALLHQTWRRVEERGVKDPEGLYKLAQSFAALGDRRSAMRALRQAVEGGFFCYPYFETDPLLDPVRNEPGFADLMNIARKRHERFRGAFEPK